LFMNTVRLCFAPTITKKQLTTGDKDEAMQVWWGNQTA